MEKIDLSKKIKDYYDFLKNNKELSLVPYLIWLAIQITVLLSILWFVWLSYLSITFSLIIFIIISFLFLLSIPTFILFCIFLAITSFFDLWNVWIFWKVWVIIYIVLLFLSPLLYKLNFIKNLEKKHLNKIKNFYVKSGTFLFFIIFIALIYFTFSFKVANIKTSNNEEFFWKYLFYNQDYYFLDICWKKIVISSDKVESLEIRTESYKIKSMKIEEKNNLNTEYNKFCESYLDNK